MNIPLICYLCLLVLGLGQDLGKHGELKDGRYNFWMGLLALSVHMAFWYASGIFGLFVK